MIIRDIEEKDIQSIIDIGSSSVYVSINEKNIKLYLGEKIYKCLCMDDNGVIKGFITGSIIDDECEITDIAVGASFKKTGVGSSLLQSFTDYAKAKNAKEIILDVNEENSEALSFYKKHNFKEYSRRKNYYQKPRISDAILMKRAI